MDENFFDTLLTWLGACPALSGVTLQVDYLPPAAGCGALFPRGIQQRERRQNVLGETVSRLRMELALRLNLAFIPGDGALAAQTAQRLLALQNWASEQSAAGLAPKFGNTETDRETLRAGAAQLEGASDEGSAVYTVTFTADYTMKWSDAQ